MRDAPDPVTPARPPAARGAEGEAARARVAAQVQAWAAAPWSVDFFAALRRLEALAAPLPRWGEAAVPAAEALRVGQAPSLAFAPASVAAFEPPARGLPVPRLRQHFFGYLGPNGPLPIQLSDVIRDRALNHGDSTWLAFLDTLLQRFALHFYRAWRQPRPAVALDRPGADPWRRWVGAFVGIGTAARQQRDAVHDDARLHFSGWLARRVHAAEGVESVIGAYFDVPARLEPWVGHWLGIAPDERCRLRSIGLAHAAPHASVAQRLGGGAVLGRRVWDRQHRVRLHLGPLALARYRSFLPTGTAQPALGGWMQQLLGDELAWDAELILKREEVPPTRLGQARGNAPRLGWLSWLGAQPRTRDAAGVRIAQCATTRASLKNTGADSSIRQSEGITRHE